MCVTTLRRLSYIWTRPADLALAAEIAAWLGLAWLMLELLPFRRTAMLLQPRIYGKGEADLVRLRRLIRAMSRRLPWRTVCFHQGIAAQRILCRRGIAADLHYGVLKKDSGGVEAHVWVTVRGEAVVGGEEAQACTLLMTFSPRNL